MSLFGTLQTGRTALAVNQAAIQTTGNNISNAGNADYTRQVAHLTPAENQRLTQGMFVGMGVDLQSIERQIDGALEGRIRSATSDANGASTTSDWLNRVESVFNELSDSDLSTRMSEFFNGWSDLANNPQDPGYRQIIVQNGSALATQFQTMRTQFESLRTSVDEQTKSAVKDIDSIASQIADLNKQIAVTEAGFGGNNTLRDQRDALLKQLSGYTEVTVSEQSGGVMNVYLGSEPLVLETRSRGLELVTKNVGDHVENEFQFKDDHSTARPSGGVMGSLIQTRETLDGSIDNLDTLAGSMIFELNKLHSAGQGLTGNTQLTGTLTVADQTAALSSKNADLDFKPNNGSFVLHVKDKTSGESSSSLINVDMDGIGADMSLDDLAAAIDATDGVSATVSSGRLSIKSDSSNLEFSFSQDTSGVLAWLGMGSFFNGTNAHDISVAQPLRDDPMKLAAARNGQPGDNQTALAISRLEEKTIDGLNGQTLKSAYQANVNEVAAQASGAKEASEASSSVLETLQNQREAVSGVSLDEEAINLMKFQRAYQGAARVISVTDELLQTLINLT